MEIEHLSQLVSQHLPQKFEDQSLSDSKFRYTFGELEQDAKNFAGKFAELHVKQGDRVIVLASASAKMVPIALGIWKRGAIYVPIDPKQPEARLNAIVENINPILIVSLDDMPSVELIRPLITLSQINDIKHEAKAEIDADHLGAKEPAVIIHTSGSTGLPKGVVLSHLSVISYFESHSKIFGLDESSRCLNTASFHYDVSIQDTFMPIYKGGSVYINQLPFLPSVFLPQITKERITHLTAVSTVLSLITGGDGNLEKYELASLKTVSTGAEVCDPKLIAEWMRSNSQLVVVNGYGPSEVNSATVSHPIRNVDESRVSYYPIGKPHENVSAMLVNEIYEPITNTNEIGELLLGGPQLMMGYWNNEEATKKAFVTKAENIYYRTGDLCYLNENNDYVFQGRKDHEEKIGGRRINLMEIAEQLNSQKGLSDVFVGVIEVAGAKKLFSIFRGGALMTNDDLIAIRKNASTSLPSYMIPTYLGLMVHGVIGRTGKLDGRELKAKLKDAIEKYEASFYKFNNEDMTFRPIKELIV